MVLLLVFICGCNTPYTGDLGPEDFNGWIESEDVNFVCLFNGFDRICIKTIRGHKGDQGIQGPAGKDGRDGIDGIDGIDGRDGMDGIDGAVIYLLLEKIVVETVFVEVPVFVLAVSKTETTYTTPVGEVYVPENAPVVAPSGVTVTPISIGGGGGSVEELVELEEDDEIEIGRELEEDDEIWHVAYTVSSIVSRDEVVEGQLVHRGEKTVEAFVYPRCFNNPYLNPPLPPCIHHIKEDEYFEETLDLKNEIQGTKEYVNEQFDLVKKDYTDVNIGGIQGIVN